MVSIYILVFHLNHKKCMTFRDIFPGLCSTLSNFQDFPGPGIFKKNPGLPRRHGTLIEGFV